MKIRTGFVSNSSSSSFVIVGNVFDNNVIHELLLNEDALKRFNERHGTSFSSFDDALESGDYCLSYDVFNAILEGTDLVAYVDEYSEEAAVGIDPCNEMKNEDTLEDFKKRVSDDFKKIGVDVPVDDIRFITGSIDSSGETYIEGRG